MRIGVASDHAGFEMKEKVREYLESEGHRIEDFGCYKTESCDYPDYARKLCRAILKNECERGVLICGTGLGMSYTANRFRGIRAALCVNTFMAEMARAHNDANVLVLGSRVIGFDAGREIVDVWMKTPFEGGRHLRRICKIDELD